MRGPGNVVTPSGARIINDPALGGEFTAAYGQYGGLQNAEDLIVAWNARQDPAVARASLSQPDAEATEEALSDLKATAKKFDLSEGEELIDAAVRGKALVGVVQTEDGRIVKRVVGWTDDWAPPALTADQAELRAKAEHDQQLAVEIARLRAEMSQKLSEEVADVHAVLSQQMAATVEAVRTAAAQQVQEAQDGAGAATTRKSGSSSKRKSASKASSKKASAKSRSRSASRSASSRSANARASAGPQGPDGPDGGVSSPEGEAGSDAEARANETHG